MELYSRSNNEWKSNEENLYLLVRSKETKEVIFLLKISEKKNEEIKNEDYISILNSMFNINLIPNTIGETYEEMDVFFTIGVDDILILILYKIHEEDNDENNFIIFESDSTMWKLN
jgi:hypothetical protein